VGASGSACHRTRNEMNGDDQYFQFALALVIYSYGNVNRARSKHSARMGPIGKSEKTLLRSR
jgi:hypothetical protein